MAEETIVAIFETIDAAQAAVADLLRSGIPSAAISSRTGSGPSLAGLPIEAGVMEPAVGQIGYDQSAAEGNVAFQGNHSYDPELYERGLRDGATIVTVRMVPSMAAVVEEILDTHHPIDLDERVSGDGYSESTSIPAVSQDAQGVQMPLRTEGISRGDVPPLVIRPK